MKLVPPIFEPFDPCMALLVACWFVVMVFTLHRATRFVALGIRLRRWTNWKPGAKRDEVSRNLNLDLEAEYARERAGESLASSWYESERRADWWSDRMLKLLAPVATLLGFLGTLVGNLAAFAALAQAPGTNQLTQLGQAMSLAIVTSIHGALIACVCMLTRACFPVGQRNLQVDERIAEIWARYVSWRKGSRRDEA